MWYICNYLLLHRRLMVQLQICKYIFKLDGYSLIEHSVKQIQCIICIVFYSECSIRVSWAFNSAHIMHAVKSSRNSNRAFRISWFPWHACMYDSVLRKHSCNEILCQNDSTNIMGTWRVKQIVTVARHAHIMPE